MAIWQYKCVLVPVAALADESHASRDMMDDESWSFGTLQLDHSLRGELDAILPPSGFLYTLSKVFMHAQ